MSNSFPIAEKHINLLNALRPFLPEPAGDFVELFTGYTKMVSSNRLDPDSVKEFATILNNVQEKQSLRAARIREAAASSSDQPRES